MNVNVSGPIGTWSAGPDPDRRAVGMVLAADQLVGVGDAVHVGDALEGAQVEVVEGVDVADQADDRADQALGDERLPAHRLDPSDDGGDVLVGRVGRHDHDHGRESRLARAFRPGQNSECGQV